ncbi:hypothetical protein [Clostridium botulinum]|uniref:hypothetical protein n=1 Tax=Clostridium botulinum TaxID=1491 RepID=UPI0004D5FF2F|nr:hypothetical protein [Clostridium botulinum]KEI02436.1 hypothetical protein Z953_07365 [Clostridium botulinum D str. 16868]
MSIWQTTKKYLLENYKALLVIFSILILSIVLSFFQLFLLIFLESSHVVMFLIILIDILLFLGILKIGFKTFKNTTYFDKALSIILGLMVYLSLMFQFAIIFFTYYLTNDSFNIIPEPQITAIFNDTQKDTSNVLQIVRLILNYVFPNFFKYPTATGLVVVFQFFLGKFTDLFILAYIVKKLKNE